MNLQLSETSFSSPESLIRYFSAIRETSLRICDPLVPEDYQVQSIVQTSPPKWHLAHVTWFFETFLLNQFFPDYKSFDPAFDYIFNSYYYGVGEMHPRAERGNLSRPSIDDVLKYRRHVDERMVELLRTVPEDQWSQLFELTIIGLNHEQQHQELLLMDIKRNFWANPLKPAYRPELLQKVRRNGTSASSESKWIERPGGIVSIGAENVGFAYDNERPRHQVLLQDHILADRFVTNGEYLQFIEDGGYDEPSHWLADGWAHSQQSGWRSPLYWIADGNEWRLFTLGGVTQLDPLEPVCHISFFEADAYARWAGKRLPLEAELETALQHRNPDSNFMESDFLHPRPAMGSEQWFGDLWAWTASPYQPYPGFRPLSGALGEYNGKFMLNQMVLKGGSCVTPGDHIRASYRNFFYPDERWMFSGIRLAEDAS